MIGFLALAAIATVPTQAPPPASPLDPVSRQLLDAHNRERQLVGVPPLVWDPFLAQAALAYGPILAASGRLQHSPRSSRPGQRENLARGVARAYTPVQLFASWTVAKRYFRAGIYPAISITGNWIDVGHYTQMIWPTTTHVGCAIYHNWQWDYLICRYTPPGNIDGKHIP